MSNQKPQLCKGVNTPVVKPKHIKWSTKTFIINQSTILDQQIIN